jgi:hypothetical protein
MLVFIEGMLLLKQPQEYLLKDFLCGVLPPGAGERNSKDRICKQFHNSRAIVLWFHH